MNEWKIGDNVRIEQDRPGGRKTIHGRGEVGAVSGNISFWLLDGTRWRYRDGYKWGSKPTRGIGRAHEERCVLIPKEGAKG